jgi:hypothetical protein
MGKPNGFGDPIRNTDYGQKLEITQHTESSILFVMKYDLFYIPVLIASTGSSLDAEIAGRIPAISPITAETIVPINILVGDNINSKSPVNCDARIETENTRTNPINPPIIAKIIASNKN